MSVSSWLFLLLIVLPAGLIAEPSGTERPMNVILFLVDDWGWTDGGVFGSDLYETPHIDRLAEQGIRFNQAYAACTVCSPTRAALMTGLYPARLHLTDWIPGHSTRYRNSPMLEPDWTQRLEHKRTTIAEVLKQKGYHTASVGKWHLTPRGEPGSAKVQAFWPENQGFDVNFGGNQWGAPGSYFSPWDSKDRIMFNMPFADRGDFLTDRLTDEALHLIDQWQSEPFFLYFSYYAVHTPVQAKPELVRKYRDKVQPGMRHTNPVYAGLVQSVDDSVGRILERLDSLGIADNTLIILTGDNGGLDPWDSGRVTNNAPLRDGKGSVYEGGVRVPCVVRLPGGLAGEVNETPIITNDFFQTILSTLDIDMPGMKTDGANLYPLLTDPGKSLPERDLFWHYPHYHTQGATPYSAIRSGDFRLIEYHVDGGVELYNLRQDPGEKTDLSGSMPGKVKELVGRLHEWRSSVDAQMPSRNPDYDSSQPNVPE